MERYECTQCGRIGESTTCLHCGSTQLRKLDPVKQAIDEAQSISPTAPDSANPVATAASLAAMPLRQRHPQEGRDPDPVPVPTAASVVAMPPRQRHPPEQEERKIGGLDKFEALLNQGAKAVVICGRGQAGKSEIAHGFIRSRKMLRGRTTTMTLGMQAGVQYTAALGGTVPWNVWYQLIDRRHVFLDPSGEFFDRFSPRYRKDMGLGDLTETYFDFVRRAVERLAGVVLVFDLTKIEDPAVDNPWEEQESVLAFTLDVLRWIRYDKALRFQELDLVTRMAFFLEENKKKLDVPVVVLFSKADRLAEDDYLNEPPLSFARQRLPTLHAALLTNARKFRFDYTHTMVRRGNVDYPAKYPCGVLLPMEWLLGDVFPWMPRLHTSLLGGGK